VQESEQVGALPPGQRRVDASSVRCIKGVTWMVAVIVSVVLSARAQQPDEQLQQELQQLKQQYEQTTHDLQQRIAALEE